jgi:hypothetical protein
MLLRSGGKHSGLQGILSSTCELNYTAPTPPPGQERIHICRPGTGIFNVALPGDRMPHQPPTATTRGVGLRDDDVGRADGVRGAADPAEPPWPGYKPVPVGRHCNWTAPVPTDIPDSHSRACTAPLPDGRSVQHMQPRSHVNCHFARSL